LALYDLGGHIEGILDNFCLFVVLRGLDIGMLDKRKLSAEFELLPIGTVSIDLL